jgi:meiotically up-regulated gene 157 (Mug157) protein
MPMRISVSVWSRRNRRYFLEIESVLSEDPDSMIPLPSTVQQTIDSVCARMTHRPKLARMFARCFPNTLETTTVLLPDETTYIFTGDIPAMWLRDSSAQVRQYLPLAKEDPQLRRVIEGLLRWQAMYVAIDPYANAFNREANGHCWREDLTERNDWVWERKFELDSLCYPLQLAYLYWRATGRAGFLDGDFHRMIMTILGVWRVEQRHGADSPYRFQRPSEEGGALLNKGIGPPVAYTGMIWSGFRPSDDACRYGYLIPSNMFAAVVLGYMGELAREVFRDAAMEGAAVKLKSEVENGIRAHGIHRHPEFGDIYAYEVDGFGNRNLMDDANIPSLLSIPYLGFTGTDDPVYRNTRRFVLSSENPYFFAGRFARGVGSPHTPQGYLWPMSLIIQALTSGDPAEIRGLLRMLEETDADTGYMHESFDPENPARYTRAWFAWANSLFGGLICNVVDQQPDLLS